MKRIIRRNDMPLKTGISLSTLWRLEKQGVFPCRIQLSANSCGWFEDEVDAWLEARRKQPQ